MGSYIGYIVVVALIIIFAIGWHLNGKEKVNYDELGVKPDEGCASCSNFLCHIQRDASENTVKKMKDDLGVKKDDN